MTAPTRTAVNSYSLAAAEIPASYNCKALCKQIKGNYVLVTMYSLFYQLISREQISIKTAPQLKHNLASYLSTKLRTYVILMSK